MLSREEKGRGKGGEREGSEIIQEGSWRQIGSEDGTKKDQNNVERWRTQYQQHHGEENIFLGEGRAKGRAWDSAGSAHPTRTRIVFISFIILRRWWRELILFSCPDLTSLGADREVRFGHENRKDSRLWKDNINIYKKNASEFNKQFI